MSSEITNEPCTCDGAVANQEATLMKPIVHTISGGSGYGTSYYSSLITCPRRSWLDAQARAEGLKASSENEATEAGTIYHALHELAEKHGDALDTKVVEYVQGGGDPWIAGESARMMGENLFRAYRVRFPPSHLGTLVAAENEGGFFDFAEEEEYDWKPSGIRVSMRLDWVRRVGVKHTLTIRTLRGVNVQPGLYAGDYKTAAGYPSPIRLEAYRQELQFMVNQFGWNTRHPKQKVNGFLVDIAWKPPKASGKVDFTLLWLPPVGDQEAKIVRGFLELAKRWQAIDPPPANPKSCFVWSPCKWLIEGKCPRY